MNGIIDDTVFTGDTVFGTTLEVASGKLKVRAQGITSNELSSNAVTTAKIIDGSITNDKINAAAAIAPSKLGSGAIPATTTVTTTNIVNASITAEKLNGAQTGTAPIFGARAFGSIEFAATRAILTGSQNIATVARDSDSRTDITFTTAMPNANYVVLVTYGDDTNYSTGIATYNRTTTGFSVRHATQSAGRIFQFVVFG
jgi:hypothetical protein